MAFKNDQVSEKETERITELAREALVLDGDYVEMGCYKGDTSLLLAEIIFSGPRRKLFIYDSFEGLPKKTKEDASVLGEDFKAGELAVTKREVKERFLRAGLPVPVIVKGWFANLAPSDLPKKIAFAFLDGDFYESIRDSLKLVLPKMTEGGILVIHDYNNPALPGVKKAADEFLKASGSSLKIILL